MLVGEGASLHIGTQGIGRCMSVLHDCKMSLYFPFLVGCVLVGMEYVLCIY